MDFHSFDAVQNHLDNLGLFHMDFELDRMCKALSALGLAPNAPFVVAQVVGTNGKGSTSTFLSSLAHAHGLKTGLYTSPHFVTPRERIRINGRLLDAERWPELASRIMRVAPELTYFEFLTALGLLAFADAKVDLVVLEAGLGGHYDATTAMPAQVVCFTPISMDHEAILGSTLTAIASDKSYAMRPGMTAFTTPQHHDALLCLRQRAREQNVVLHEVTTAPLPPLGLSGPHQQINARLALTVWEYLSATFHWPLHSEAIRTGLATARLAGRFQSVPALPEYPALPLVLDGAHNPHGLHALEAALKAEGITPSAVIFSCLADKDMDAMLPILCRLAGEAPIIVPTIQDNERAMLSTELAQRLTALSHSAQILPVQRLSLALKEAHLSALDTPGAQQKKPVLVCGSLYLLGEFFTLYPHTLEDYYH